MVLGGSGWFWVVLDSSSLLAIPKYSTVAKEQEINPIRPRVFDALGSLGGGGVESAP